MESSKHKHEWHLHALIGECAGNTLEVCGNSRGKEIKYEGSYYFKGDCRKRFFEEGDKIVCGCGIQKKVKE